MEKLYKPRDNQDYNMLQLEAVALHLSLMSTNHQTMWMNLFAYLLQ